MGYPKQLPADQDKKWDDEPAFAEGQNAELKRAQRFELAHKLCRVVSEEDGSQNAAINAIGNPEAEKYAQIFAQLLVEGAIGPKEENKSALCREDLGGSKGIPVLFMGLKEAELTEQRAESQARYAA